MSFDVKPDDIGSVCVVGLGQIGGSLAFSLSKKGFKVFGISRKKETVEKALKLGIIHDGGNDLNILRNSDFDVVFLAVHLSLYKEIMEVMRGFRGILSDVGSVKRGFALLCQDFGFNFAGSHPIAGTEKSGIDSASPELFEGKICIVSGWSSDEAKNKVSKIWEIVGCRVIFMSPEEHDRTLAFISHLPHVIAFSVLNSIPDIPFMGGSLSDITRVAKSPPEMWVDIFLENSDMVEFALQTFINELHKFRVLINEKNREKILQYILNAKKKI